MQTCSMCGHPADGKYRTKKCSNCEEGLLRIAQENDGATVHGAELVQRLDALVQILRVLKDAGDLDGDECEALMYASEVLHKIRNDRRCAYCDKPHNHLSDIVHFFESAFDQHPSEIVSICDRDACQSWQDTYRNCIKCERQINADNDGNFPEEDVHHDNFQVCARCISEEKKKA